MKNEGKESFIHYSAQYIGSGIVMYYRFTLLNKIEKFLVLWCFPPNKQFFKVHLELSFWMKCSGNKTVVNLFREDALGEGLFLRGGGWLLSWDLNDAMRNHWAKTSEYGLM